MSETTCLASTFGAHDYSAGPHATADHPRPLGHYGDKTGDCHAQSASGPPWCEHEQRYEIVMFCIGAHEWITLRACVPCTATIRARHRPDDVHSVRSLRPVAASVRSKGEQR